MQIIMAKIPTPVHVKPIYPNQFLGFSTVYNVVIKEIPILKNDEARISIQLKGISHLKISDLRYSQSFC